MPQIQYIEKRFSPSSLKTIAQAIAIIEDYTKQGYDLTLRQLFYQFVARDLIPNKVQEYNRLGDIINNARLAGLIDWNQIVDRVRKLQGNPHWTSPQDIIEGAAKAYGIDKWADQDFRPEVWIEKNALIGVIEGICRGLDVPYLACIGYNSQSEMWRASRRILRSIEKKQTPVIFHLGDHDPSGRDMTFDILRRMKVFLADVKVERLALNMDQIQEHKPPPNPAKLTDPRAMAYIAEFGNESWELDALDPISIRALVETAVKEIRDDKKWEAMVKREEDEREQIQDAAGMWPDIVEFMEGH